MRLVLASENKWTLPITDKVRIDIANILCILPPFPTQNLSFSFGSFLFSTIMYGFNDALENELFDGIFHFVAFVFLGCIR